MSGKKPVGNAWGGALKVVLNDIGQNFDEPMWIEWADKKYGFVGLLECDSDILVASRIVEKQLMHEEADRYPTTLGLRYGI